MNLKLCLLHFYLLDFCIFSVLCTIIYEVVSVSYILNYSIAKCHENHG